MALVWSRLWRWAPREVAALGTRHASQTSSWALLLLVLPPADRRDLVAYKGEPDPFKVSVYTETWLNTVIREAVFLSHHLCDSSLPFPRIVCMAVSLRTMHVTQTQTSWHHTWSLRDYHAQELMLPTLFSYTALQGDANMLCVWVCVWVCVCVRMCRVGHGTVYMHCIWPYIWWIICQKHQICMVLANPTHVSFAKIQVFWLSCKGSGIQCFWPPFWTHVSKQAVLGDSAHCKK
jgi:hypothetical protein